MSKHIWLRNDFSIASVRSVLNTYHKCKETLSTDASKAWAAYQLENVNQRGTWIRQGIPTLRSKAHGFDKYVKAFDHIVEKGLNGLWKDEPMSLSQLVNMYLKSRPSLKARLSLAAKAVKTVLNINLNAKGKFQFLVDRSLINDWSKTQTGRQLFIKGWGSFDIQAAVAQLLSKEFLGFNRLPFHPFILQRLGYDLPLSVYQIRAILKSRLLVDYIGKWKQFYWTDTKQVGTARRRAIDELLYAQDRMEGFDGLLRLHPTVLMERISDWREAQSIREVVKYSHLSNIPQFEVGGMLLKPVQDTRELASVGRSLHNCAATYNDRIIRQQCFLMVCTDQSGKPLALAEVTTDKDGLILGQVAGPCNQEAPEEIKNAFMNCLTQMVKGE